MLNGIWPKEPRSWAGCQKEPIRMCRKELGDLLIVAADIGQAAFELAGEHLDAESSRLGNRRILA